MGALAALRREQVPKRRGAATMRCESGRDDGRLRLSVRIVVCGIGFRSEMKVQIMRPSLRMDTVLRAGSYLQGGVGEQTGYLKLNRV